MKSPNRSPLRRRSPMTGAGAIVGAVLAGASVLVGMAGSAAAATAPSSAYPVTVSDCGVPVTYDSAPTRAVSNDIPTTEDMLALGLGSHMAGDFGVSKKGPFGEEVATQYQSAFGKIRDVSSGYFTLEQLVKLHPDFLFAGWNYGLQVDTNLTPTNLANYGIKTLALTESCAHVEPDKDSVSIDDTYQDITELGEIFNVRGRAQRLINQMKTTVTAVQKKVAGLPTVSVAEIDGDDSGAPFTAPGLAMPTSLMALGGGANIFASLKQTWTSVSWEQVVAANPQCIIIDTYGTSGYAPEKTFLETSAITKNLTAVKNKCFLGLTYDQVTPSPRNAGTVVAIAHWLHPKTFGFAADGS